MRSPRDLRRMEEFWLTRGGWFLVTALEGLAVLCVVAAVVLVVMGIYYSGERPQPASLDETIANLDAELRPPFCFGGAVSCVGSAIGLLLTATVLRFRGSFRLLIHHQIPTPVPEASIPVFGSSPGSRSIR